MCVWRQEDVACCGAEGMTSCGKRLKAGWVDFSLVVFSCRGRFGGGIALVVRVTRASVL